jgi:NADH-quinone oxidoreductase subunit E
MSVRRLAEESVQPAEFAFNREFSAQAKVWIKKYPKERAQSAVIPLMMLAQEQDGWVTKRAIEVIADMLGMPYIRALEVATFYTQFQLKPVGKRAHIQVCGTTPCMLRGSEALMDVCRSKIHPEPFQLNESGTLSWEEVECQGACVNAPMVMIFKDSYEDLSPERLAYIIDRFEAGRPEDVTPGPQINRIFSGPEGGLTSLSEEIKPAKKFGAKASAASGQSPAATKAGRPKSPATETATKSPAAAKANVKADAKSVDAATDAPPVAAPVKGTVGKGTAAKTDAVPSLDDKNRPAGISKPAEPDNLKLISGVGPKIEGILHSLGIFTFAQVASWTTAEREWVDGYLRFKGRIERDDWLNQAKALAKGGEAEYIRVFGKKPR